MPVSEPGWWYERDGTWQSVLLTPVAALFGKIASDRIRKATPYRSLLPVICVGNFTAGGSGKTPLALLLGRLVAEEGREPWFLSRGYGGKLRGPVRVDVAHHTASDVGDEPLLLARAFPTVVARDRREGARTIEMLASKRAVIIMDDGLQNPSLAKDLSIAVVDAQRGFGNGRVIPAGPLRAPLEMQAKLARLIVLMGRHTSSSNEVVDTLSALTDVSVVMAETQPDDRAARFRGCKVFAFAGIANPDRFYALLSSLGADIVGKRTFADHHAFTQAEAGDLLAQAERAGAALVTTEKDLVRLSGAAGRCAQLRERSEAIAIRTAIQGDGLDVLRVEIRRALAR